MRPDIRVRHVPDSRTSAMIHKRVMSEMHFYYFFPLLDQRQGQDDQGMPLDITGDQSEHDDCFTESHLQRQDPAVDLIFFYHFYDC